MRADIKFEILPHGRDLPLPAYHSLGAAGFDLAAALETDLALAPGARALIPTGLKLELPKGLEGQVRPRSGLALKHGVTVLNAPGTIDSDYRGEILVLLINMGDQIFFVRRGERIAQMVIASFEQAQLTHVANLAESARGEGGFGSTG